jgi:hypothetical protein
MPPNGSMNEAAVMRALARAPQRHTIAEICESTGIPKFTVSSIIGRLLMRKDAVYVGRAMDAKVAGRQGQAKLYGPREAAPVETKREPERSDDVRIAQPITISQYRWGSGRYG